MHNLSRATNVDARLTRLEERSRNVQLTDESICDSCRARLGTKLFVMYPDDSVVCYRVTRPTTWLFSCLFIIPHGSFTRSDLVVVVACSATETKAILFQDEAVTSGKMLYSNKAGSSVDSED